jgi:AcrR family transcriptional regulator
VSRLTRLRWIEEGLSALRSEGPAALAADRLARKLGVSRGSFYWHFASAPDFEAAVLGEWAERWTGRIVAAVEAGADDPRERLRSLIEKTGGEDASLYAAAKLMARRHPELAAIMGRVDESRTGFVAGLLISGGVDRGAAQLRARIVYAWAMGQMLIGDGGTSADPALAACLTDFAFGPPESKRLRQG